MSAGEERWPTAEEDPSLRGFGPGLMHVERMRAAVPRNLGTAGVPCPKCGKPVGEFCYGGSLSDYPPEDPA